jgi:fatty acid desaturase 2 (delta-6 desaturase)
MSTVGLDAETISRHAALTADFKSLHKELESEGFFRPSLPHVIYRLAELTAFWGLGVWLISVGHPIAGILSLALFQGRCGWLMHEGGHHSLTGRPKVDRFIQAVVYGEYEGRLSRLGPKVLNAVFLL